MERNMAIENVTLLLDDPLNVEDFVEDYQKSLSQFTSLDANNEEFKPFVLWGGKRGELDEKGKESPDPD